MTLAYAGSRLSAALALTADRVDLGAGVLVFETLQKRQAGIYRAVPVPPALLETRSTSCTASASSRRVVARPTGPPSPSARGAP
jgi:integrase